MCPWLTRLFLALYLLALAILLIGTFGLMGQEQDPLSGVFLLPLGLPWILMLDTTPDVLLPWLTAAAPLVNLVLLRLVCRWRAARATR